MPFWGGKNNFGLSPASLSFRLSLSKLLQIRHMGKPFPAVTISIRSRIQNSGFGFCLFVRSSRPPGFSFPLKLDCRSIASISIPPFLEKTYQAEISGGNEIIISFPGRYSRCPQDIQHVSRDLPHIPGKEHFALPTQGSTVSLDLNDFSLTQPH